jgi:hypothetical protein
MSQQEYTLTIQPGVPDYDEHIKCYITRTNYGNDMTIYTFDNKKLAESVQKRLENRGYIIHLEEPDGSSSLTEHTKIHGGITIG